jgi:membrane protease YdiL (CAAX protease family)
VIVVVSIALGAAYQGAVALLERNPNVSLSEYTQWNIVLNVLVYVVVGGLVLSQVTPKVRLRWGEGPALMRAGFGAACGILGGGLAVAATSAAEDHLSTDPRAIHMMSGGDLAHVAITILLVCVAAPLVEETLFRGLLLESLRQHALGMAIVVSAMFFAVWHLSKAGLAYYTAMGCVFGALYVKRGLVASMSAHAGFNGVLVLTALSIVLGPSHSYDIGGLRIAVPGGWTKEDPEKILGELGIPAGDDSALLITGPDSTGIAIVDIGPMPAQFDADQIVQSLRSNLSSIPLPAGSSYDTKSLREESLPTVGTAVEMDFTVHSTRSEFVFFAYGGELFFTFGLLGDNPNARSDFEQILKTLQPVPVLAPAS